jgi:tetratricopeptide (TPR) repeat protein
VKDKARKLELKGQLDKAITQYAKILDELEGRPELTDELALYNKLGDLYLKRGDVGSAVEQYEAAVTHYAEQGFPNNAIALCNKILRNAPGRTHVYLKLAKLMMQRGFVAEAKQNLLEYAERMQKAGQVEDAFHALKEFADLSPDNEEIRLLLAEQLKNAARTEEAREQLAKLYHELQQSGNTPRARKTLERMKAIDPAYEVSGAPTPQMKSHKQKSSDIVFIDLDDDRKVETAAAVEQPEVSTAVDEPLVVEPTSMGEQTEVLDDVTVDESLAVEHASAELDIDADAAGVAQLDGLEMGESLDLGDDTQVESLDIETTVLDDSLATEEEVPDSEKLPVIDMPADVDVNEGDVGDLDGLVAEGDELSDVFAVAPDSEESKTEVIELEDEPGREQIAAAERESIGELEIAAFDDPAGDTEPGLLDDGVIEAGVEVPELDVEGFESVPEFEEPTEDDEGAGALADLPVLDTGNDLDTAETDEVSDVAVLAELDVSDSEDDVAKELVGLDTESADDDLELLAEYEVEDEDEGEDSVAAVAEDEQPEIELLTEYELEDTEPEREDEAAAVAVEEPTEPPMAAAPDISELESRVLDDPGAPDPHRALAEALIESGERERGLEELEIALTAYEGLSDWRHAQAVAEEILRLEPNSVHHHQKRVEYAYRMDDRQALAAAYLQLADALVRSGDVERARVVYQRVLEHDPESDRARVALDTLTLMVEEAPEPGGPEEPGGPVGLEEEEEVTLLGPEGLAEITESSTTTEPEPAEPDLTAVSETAVSEPAGPVELEEEEEVALLGPEDLAEITDPSAATEPERAATAGPAGSESRASGFVDLGALILEEEQARDTRMRIQPDEPTGDEDRDFQTMLSEFKKGIDANIELEDSQAHYDLGVAFREMGLLDEAISEFQKALRSAQDRLRTAEALGLCFFDKGQFAVATTVLKRAVDAEAGGDDEKIGLLYWLGRCEEKQGHGTQALSHYQRIFAIDIDFQDVKKRVKQLAQADS